MALVRSDSPPPNASSVTGKTYLMASKQGIAEALTNSRKPSDVRLYLGYAGWGPGQLASEVRRGGWWIFGYDESLVFDEHPETLWSRLIRRTELQKVSLPFVQPAVSRRTVSSQ